MRAAKQTDSRPIVEISENGSKSFAIPFRVPKGGEINCPNCFPAKSYNQPSSVAKHSSQLKCKWAAAPKANIIADLRAYCPIGSVLV